MNNRSQPPKALTPREFNFPEFERSKLANGLQIIFARHAKLPTVAFQLVVHSGADKDPAGKEGLASLVTDLLPEGTKKRSSFDLSQSLEYLGTQFSAHTDWNSSFLEMISLKKNLAASLDLFSDILFNAQFAEPEILRIKKRLLNQRLKVADNASRIANEKFAELLYPDFRYGIPLGGRSLQINSIVKNDIIDFYTQNYKPQNATLIIVGDLSFNEAQKVAGDYFANWTPGSSKEHVRPMVEAPSGGTVHLVHKENAQQAEIRIGQLGISRHDPDYFNATLLNQILGGYFLSRLNMNLREDKGYTYGVSSRFITRKALGPFLISSAVETQFALPAVQEVFKEIEKLTTETVSDEELEQAKGYLSGIFPIAFENASQIAAGLSNIVVFDLADDYYRSYRAKIAEIKKENILKTAKKFLNPDKLITVVCTDNNLVQTKFAEAFEIDLSIFKADQIS